jgi:transcriptional regulator with XRE-family HTH domain
MTPKGRGYGVTPVEVVSRLKEAVSNKSQYAVAKESGLALSVIQGLLKGDREPSSSTLNKLSIYLCVPVWKLRGERPLGKEAVDLIYQLSDCIDKLSKEKLSKTGSEYFVRLKELVDVLVDLAKVDDDLDIVLQMKNERIGMMCKDPKKKYQK